MDKFRADPYNKKNNLLQETDVINIMKQLNINDFTITNLSFYQQAFCHKSYCYMKDYEDYQKPDDCIPLFKTSYETLEFIGDSFLSNSVVSYLYDRYVINFNQEEGFLTKLKIRLVNGEQLAYLSKLIGLDRYIIISKHIEDNCDGRNNQHILEDVLEAFIGALYIDTRSYETVDRFIIQLLEQNIDFCDLIMKDNNFKDQILRYFQHNFKVYPTYQHIQDESNNRFKCHLLKDNEIISSGYGDTKKKSEQDASKHALVKYHVISE